MDLIHKGLLRETERISDLFSHQHQYFMELLSDCSFRLRGVCSWVKHLTIALTSKMYLTVCIQSKTFFTSSYFSATLPDFMQFNTVIPFICRRYSNEMIIWILKGLFNRIWSLVMFACTVPSNLPSYWHTGLVQRQRTQGLQSFNIFLTAITLYINCYLAAFSC